MAVAGAAFIATARPSANPPGTLSVKVSTAPAGVLPGESTLMVITVTNVGGASLTGVTVTESLPAALTYVAGSVVAGKLDVSSPGLLVSSLDGIDLAAGQT